MALIKCPECGGKVSDKADKCIHCGYPMKSKKNKKNNERRKTPIEVLKEMQNQNDALDRLVDDVLKIKNPSIENITLPLGWYF